MVSKLGLRVSVTAALAELLSFVQSDRPCARSPSLGMASGTGNSCNDTNITTALRRHPFCLNGTAFATIMVSEHEEAYGRSMMFASHPLNVSVER